MKSSFDSQIHIDNKRANLFLSPVFGCGYYYFLQEKGLSVNFEYGHDTLSTAILATLIFIYCSYFIQPDLDHHVNRAGKETFPLGSNLKYRFKFIIKGLLFGLYKSSYGKKFVEGLVSVCYFPIWLINRAWYYFWEPYGLLFTHRGVSHFPIFGTLSRIFYVWILFYFFSLSSSATPYFVKRAIDILESMFPWNVRLHTELTLLVTIPLYVADIAHTIVDAIDSFFKGNSFCPPQIPRGALVKTINLIIRRKL